MSPHSLSVHSSRHPNYENCSMDTVESRSEAPMEFLQICLLLTHMSQNVSLYDPINRCHVDPSFNLFPWEPWAHAWQEILQHLDPSKPKLLHHTGRNYLARVLSIRGLGGLNFNMVYRGNFFTQQFFTFLTSIDTWAMSPQAQPIPCNDTNSMPALHLYNFLREFRASP
jgi:hypothetical protein